MEMLCSTVPITATSNTVSDLLRVGISPQRNDYPRYLFQRCHPSCAETTENLISMTNFFSGPPKAAVCVMRTRRLFTCFSLLLCSYSTVTHTSPTHNTTFSDAVNPFPHAKATLSQRSIIDYHVCSPDQENLIIAALNGVSAWCRVAISVTSGERTNNIWYNMQRRATFNHWFGTRGSRVSHVVHDHFSRLRAEVLHTRGGEVTISCDNTADLAHCEGDRDRWSNKNDAENLLWLVG